MFNPDTAPGGGSYFVGPFEAAARSAAVDAAKAPVHSDAEIETVIASLGQDQAGLVVMTDSFMAVHGGTVVSAAARHNVPTTFSQAGFARYGGLISYGPYQLDIYTRPAMSIASCGEQSRVTCRLRSRPSTSWGSISRPPRRSD
jgi:putative ABC transport system substrate-binding protein